MQAVPQRRSRVPFESATSAQASLAARYRAVRRASTALADGLSDEDCALQSMPDASPVKWHLAHTTWFFEVFVLERFAPAYVPAEPRYRVLFNSYYNGIGEQFSRPLRGMLSRPGLDVVRRYRDRVDEALCALLAGASLPDEALALVELGTHHEQQHQELMLTDVKHLFSLNPLAPAYRDRGARRAAPAAPLEWVGFEGCAAGIGHEGSGFAFDNELPRHQQPLMPYELASRPVTNGEYRAFMEDGGYARPELWLSDGWTARGTQGWTHPAYWAARDSAWFEFTLRGLEPLDPARPVTHLSQFEADAYARWAGARLPTEFEWERAAGEAACEGNFAESGALHPEASPALRLAAMYGDVWEWTASAYAPYPRYRPAPGAVGEYNGKFMSNQYVLRGGSCATPRSHIRATYRNFFPSAARWQFSGVRLARDAG
jgi:ergothioneine biosynthesis protein EgtB